MKQKTYVVEVLVGVVVFLLMGAAISSQWNNFALIGLIILILGLLFGTGAGILGLVHWSVYLRERVKGTPTLTPPPSSTTKLLEQAVSGKENDDKAPPFEELVRQGLIGPGRPFVLGFDGMGMRTVDAILTTGIAGLNSTGKTTTTLFVLLQLIVNTLGNVRFIVVDPHMDSGTDESLVEMISPLQPFFLTLEEVRSTVPPDDREYLDLLNHATHHPNPNAGGEAGLLWSRIVHLEMERRLKGKKGAKWVLIMDEFTRLMGRDEMAKTVPAILEGVAQEARKVNMICILIGQNWKATRTGGTELRNSVGCWFGHRMNRAVADLILPKDALSNVERLDVGQCVAVDYKGQISVVRVPYTTMEDAYNIIKTYEHLVPSVGQVTVQEVGATGQLYLSSGEDVVEGQITEAIPFSISDVDAVMNAVRDGFLSDADIARVVWPDTKDAAGRLRKRAEVKNILSWLVLKGGERV